MSNYDSENSLEVDYDTSSSLMETENVSLSNTKSKVPKRSNETDKTVTTSTHEVTFPDLETPPKALTDQIKFLVSNELHNFQQEWELLMKDLKKSQSAVLKSSSRASSSTAASPPSSKNLKSNEDPIVSSFPKPDSKVSRYKSPCSLVCFGFGVGMVELSTQIVAYHAKYNVQQPFAALCVELGLVPIANGSLKPNTVGNIHEYIRFFTTFHHFLSHQRLFFLNTPNENPRYVDLSKYFKVPILGIIKHWIKALQRLNLLHFTRHNDPNLGLIPLDKSNAALYGSSKFNNELFLSKGQRFSSDWCKIYQKRCMPHGSQWLGRMINRNPNKGQNSRQKRKRA
jgi:hypothetical protein